MKNILNGFVFAFISFGSVSSSAGEGWKTAGEHFESKYLLKQAFFVYRLQAEKGDPDAQFRQGVLYEQSNPTQINNAKYWYRKAATQGHEYAKSRLNILKKPKKDSDYKHELVERTLCEAHVSNLGINQAGSLFHVESLALLGQSECMLALGHWFQGNLSKNNVRAYYWLFRAAFTARSVRQQEEASYQLALFLSRELGSDSKEVVSLVESAARGRVPDAVDWLEDSVGENGRRAYVSYLQSLGSNSFVDYMATRLPSNSTGDSYVYPPNRLKEAKSRYQNAFAQAWAVNSSEFPGVASNIIQLLRSPIGKQIDVETQFQLVFESLRRLKPEQISIFSKEHELVSFLVSLISPSSSDLRQIQLALQIRRLLVLKVDTQELDRAIADSMERFYSGVSLSKSEKLKNLFFKYNDSVDSIDRSVLKSVLDLTKESGSCDLFLLFFNKLFENELSHLEFLMRMEDLHSGLSVSSSSAPQVFLVAGVLADLLDDRVGVTKESFGLIKQFPKLHMLKDAHLSVSALSPDRESSLFTPALSALNRIKQAAQNYQATRFYFWSYTLTATLSSRHIIAVKESFKFKIQKLSELFQEFMRNAADKNYVIDSIAAKSLSKQSIRNSIGLKTERLKQYLAEFLATQNTLDAQTNYDVLHAERKRELKSSAGLKMFQRIAGETEFYSVTPADSKMSPERVAFDKSVLYSHRSEKLNKNEVLTIKSSGEWSPLCALRHSALVDKVDGILVGPEGFRAQLSHGNAAVSGKDQRTSSAQFSSSSKTTNAGIDWIKAAGTIVGGVVGAIVGIPGGPPGMAAGAAFGATMTMPFTYSDASQKMTGESKTSEQSDYKQTSQFQSSTAAFQSGLRLPHAPFPGLPAGAYVAIVLSKEKEDFGQIIDSFVMQSQSTYVAHKKSEIFFIVNDCTDNKSSGSLTVQLQKHVPANAEVERLMSTMDANIKAFSKKGEALVKEGGDLGSRIETLKVEVIAELQKSSIADFMSDPTLRSVFYQWLSQESDKIVRKARILDLGRHIHATRFDLEGMNKYLGMESDQENYFTKRMGSLVKNAAHIALFDSQIETVEHATRYILPLLQLYFPSGVSHLVKKFSHSEYFTENGQFDLEVAVREVKYLSEQLLEGLDAEWAFATTANYVIVRMPRPGTQMPETKQPDVPVISEERAKLFWDHLFGEEPKEESIGIKLTYADLYQEARQARLSLNQEAPIIIDMVLLLGHDRLVETDYLQSQFAVSEIGIQVGREQVFAMVQGPKSYLLTNDDLRSYQISLGFVNTQELISDAIERIRSELSMNLNTAKGLSPFSSFSFGRHSRATLESLKNTLKLGSDAYPMHLTDVFIVMKVVSTNRYESINWMKSQGK